MNFFPGQENELILMAVLDCLFNCVSGILRKNVDKKSLCDNMEVIMLAMDEMIDNGMIMESDPQQIVSRVALRSDDIPIGEQTVAQVITIKGCTMHKCKKVKKLIEAIKKILATFFSLNFY